VIKLKPKAKFYSSPYKQTTAKLQWCDSFSS